MIKTRMIPEQAKHWGWYTELHEAQTRALDAMQQLGWTPQQMLNANNFRDEAHVLRILKAEGFLDEAEAKSVHQS